MSIEELLTLYRQYLNWKGVMTNPSFDGFMKWLETEYWLKKPTPTKELKEEV